MFNRAEAREGPAPGVTLMPEGFWLSPHLFLLLLLFGSGITVGGVLEGKTQNDIKGEFLGGSDVAIRVDMAGYTSKRKSESLHPNSGCQLLPAPTAGWARHPDVSYCRRPPQAGPGTLSWRPQPPPDASILFSLLGVTLQKTVRKSCLIDHLQLARSPQSTCFT